MKSLYFIEAGRDGPVKLGLAADPRHRLRALQTGCPIELRLLGQVALKSNDDAEWLESWVHEAADHLRIRGEWFQPEVIDFLYEHAERERDWSVA